MSVTDYLLEGLEAELALERELGVRLIEVGEETQLLRSEAHIGETRPRETAHIGETRPREEVDSEAKPQTAAYDFIFLHDRPLSPAGNEMMAKIIVALGRTAESAPVVIVPPRPKAKMTVVLGGLALRKYFPQVKGVPGQFHRAADGTEILVTYSPEYILRFKEVTPAVKKIKHDMWLSLKAVARRFQQDRG